LTGPKAFELGFADRLLEPAEFVDESIAFALCLGDPGDSQSAGDRARDEDVAEVIRKATARLDDQVNAATPGPYNALELIEGALSGWSLEEGARPGEGA